MHENDNSQVSEVIRLSSADHTQTKSPTASEVAPSPRSNPIHLTVDVDILTRFRGLQPVPVTRFSKSQIENFEFADFAKLWKEYINR